MKRRKGLAGGATIKVNLLLCPSMGKVLAHVKIISINYLWPEEDWIPLAWGTNITNSPCHGRDRFLWTKDGVPCKTCQGGYGQRWVFLEEI